VIGAGFTALAALLGLLLRNTKAPTAAATLH